MFDKILGRKQLKEEIKRLREHNKKLEKKLSQASKEKEIYQERLEKAEKRRKKAVTRKQASDKEINRLKDKIKSLNQKIRKIEEKSKGKPKTRKGLGRKKFQRIISIKPVDLRNRLEGFRAQEKDLVTLVSKNFSQENVLKELSSNKNLINLNQLEKAGVLYHDPKKVLSLAAVPVHLKSEPGLSYGKKFDLSFIDFTDLRKNQVFCFARIGEAAVAKFSEGKLESFKKIDSSVKSKHSKGGFSQKRFDRLREEQVEKHLEKVCQKLQSLLQKNFFLSLSGENMVLKKILNKLDQKLDKKSYSRRSLDLKNVEKKQDILSAEKSFWEILVYIM